MTEVDPLAQYRKWLVETEHQASRDFDKAIMTLSAGALGISIAFVRDLAPQPVLHSVKWLGYAWASLSLSLLAILISLLISQFALRRAIGQVDKGTIRTEHPGGLLATLTVILNILAALALIAGVGSLAFFALANVGGE